MICRGYHFQMGINRTESADVQWRGFHCVQNPLDCLWHYPDVVHSEYYLVDAAGDCDEGDTDDTQFACTELNVIKRLAKCELFLHGLIYMQRYPTRTWSQCVQEDRGMANRGFSVVRGLDPIACGCAVGDVLALAVEDLKGTSITKMGLAVVDGETILPGVWYNAALERSQVCQL